MRFSSNCNIRRSFIDVMGGQTGLRFRSHAAPAGIADIRVLRLLR
jgi:hypothetical protein